MLATKIAGWAHAVVRAAPANGSSPTSAAARSASSGHAARARSPASGVRLPWPGKRIAVVRIA